MLLPVFLKQKGRFSGTQASARPFNIMLMFNYYNQKRQLLIALFAELCKIKCKMLGATYMAHYSRTCNLAIKLTIAALGLLAIPSGVSAATANTTVSSNISAAISLLTSNGTVNINVIPTGSGVQTIASDTVTVSTNDAAGYTLQLGETGASSALVSGSNTIAAVAGTQAAPIAETANSWGYRVDGVGGFGAGPTSAVSNAAIGSATFAAVPATASPNTLKTTATTASNDTTTVWYGIAANTTAASGTYTNSVTYTAVAN